jgi:DnaK suppressor protein
MEELLAKSPYPAKFLKEMRKVLLEKRAEIMSNINSSHSSLQSKEGYHLADVEDLASDAADEATTYEILEIERRELEQIDRALKAMDDGSYGVCEELGTPIGEERLRALPFATLSIEAQRARERAQRGEIEAEEEAEEEQEDD